jgi:predicted AlkP superfamily phosphohydrolase/phosphomutase
MSLPRWAVYPALVVIVALAVAGVPRRKGADAFAGAAAAVRAGAPLASGAREARHEHVVVLGIDGMDPDILAEVIQAHPDRMRNFRWLVERGGGIHALGTSTPPQSPVAWSNFITGLNPGGHGVFDFIHRDPVTREPASSTTRTEDSSEIDLPGPYKLPLGGEVESNRSGRSFWSILRDHGVPADIWRMPANFPVEPSSGVSFPGMMTPALDSAYGECSFLTTDPLRNIELDYHKSRQVTLYDGRLSDRIEGPPNPFRDGDPLSSVPIGVTVDRENGAALIDVGDEKVILRPGQWSGFVHLGFDLLPMGMMGMSGICRFYLRSIEPEVELYVSPVNLDPSDPATPVSQPGGASADLADAIGLYYTQGMAEDVNALKNGVLTDPEFMQQVELVLVERRRMLDYALDRYARDGDGGLLFFYFSTIDLTCHMMWRHFDGAHPAHDPELAAADSSDWSKRPGSTWRDTVHDLYLRMDPVVGRIRERLGDGVTLIVMSDHGFAPYRRKFSLNTWLVDNGYLVLKEGEHKELPKGHPGHQPVFVFTGGAVDWTRTRAYGIGFNGLYLNLAGREQDDPKTPEDESGIVQPGPEARALLRELAAKLESLGDPVTGLKPILRCDLASDVYAGARASEAPDMIVGYNAGYGNSDPASTGRIPATVLEDNTGGTFNGSHLMAPEVVSGVLLSNRPVRAGVHCLEDLTVEILRRYGIDPAAGMRGRPVLE